MLCAALITLRRQRTVAGKLAIHISGEHDLVWTFRFVLQNCAFFFDGEIHLIRLTQ